MQIRLSRAAAALLAVVLAAGLLAGCGIFGTAPRVEPVPAPDSGGDGDGGGDGGVPTTPPDITGTITRAERDRILIEERPEEQTGNKSMVTVAPETLIYRQRGEQVEPVTAGALNTGQRVSAWFSGPVLESYPSQAGARVILILEE